MCLYPKLIPNPKYRTSKKRGYYKPSPHDARLNYVPVACGKCYECRKKKAREWRIRLAEEIRHNKSYFITLTIDDENLEMLKNELEVKTIKGNENNIATLALRKFLGTYRDWETKDEYYNKAKKRIDAQITDIDKLIKQTVS